MERWPLKRGLNMSECMDCPMGQKNWPVLRRGGHFTEVAISGGCKL